MNEPLDELYLKWLYSHVGNTRLRNPKRTYWDLLRQLYRKEFVWIISRDDNRLADGLELRREFVETTEYRFTKQDANWLQLGCSLLEMMIALCRHLNFEDDSQTVDEWFWELVTNLHLHKCNDASRFNEAEVDEILDDLIWRTYEPCGLGGLFPLNEPEKDQREVEIWYQLQTYLLETD